MSRDTYGKLDREHDLGTGRATHWRRLSWSRRVPYNLVVRRVVWPYHLMRVTPAMLRRSRPCSVARLASSSVLNKFVSVVHRGLVRQAYKGGSARLALGENKDT